MAFWSKRAEIAEVVEPRVAGWTAEEFSTLVMHERIELHLPTVDRTAAWHADFLLDGGTRPKVDWEIEGWVDHYSQDVRIPVTVERANRIPDRLLNFKDVSPDRLRKQLAGYVCLNARYDEVRSDELTSPLLNVHLRGAVFHQVIRAIQLAPSGPGVPRLRVFTMGREDWSYDAFKASIGRGEEVCSWSLPLRAAVVWTHWRFS